MLAGEAPYTGPTAQAVIAKRFSGQIPSARSRRDVVPPAMDVAIQRALAIDRNDRFATAEELVAAMTSEGGTTKAPASTTKRSGCRSTAAALVAVLVLLTALVIGTGASWWRVASG